MLRRTSPWRRTSPAAPPSPSIMLGSIETSRRTIAARTNSSPCSPTSSQSPGADPERRRDPPDARHPRAESPVGQRRDRAAGRATGPAGRRPARHLADHRRQDPASQGARGCGRGRRARGRDEPALDRRSPARADRHPSAAVGARQRRPRSARAGAGQPPQQRGEVYRGRRADRARGGANRRRSGLLGARQWDRDRAGAGFERLRPVHPGQPLTRPLPGRAGSRIDPGAPTGGDAWGKRPGVQRRRQPR